MNEHKIEADMEKALSELREYVTSEGRYLSNHLRGLLSGGYIPARRRELIADYVRGMFDAVGKKIDFILGDAENTPDRGPFDSDKANALIFVGDLLGDPKVRYNPVLNDYMELLYFEMFVDLTAEPIDRAVIHPYIVKAAAGIISRCIGKNAGAETAED